MHEKQKNSTNLMGTEVVNESMKVLVSLFSLLLMSQVVCAQQDHNFAQNGHYNVSYSSTSPDYVYFLVAAKDGGFFYGTYDHDLEKAYIQKIRLSGEVDSSFASGLFEYHPGIPIVSLSFFDIKELNDGSYLVGGTMQGGGLAGSYALVLKLDAQGDLDHNYNVDGRVTYAYNFLPSQGRQIILDADEKFWIAGTYGVNISISRLFVAKFNQDGTVDQSFGSNGAIARNVLNSTFFIPAHFTQIGANSFMILGAATVGQFTQDVALKFSKSGIFDANFGTAGEKVFSGHPTFRYSRVTKHKNHLYLIGALPTNIPNQGKAAVARTDTNLILDPSYATGGIDSDFLNTTDLHGITSVDIDAAENIFFSGAHFKSNGADFVIMKKDLATNSFDPSFGTNGILYVRNNNSTNDFCNWACLLKDESLIVGGQYYPNTSTIPDLTFCRIYRQHSLGLEAVEELNGISIYPNPNKGQFFIRAEKEVQNAELSITNYLGQTIVSKKIKRLKQELIDLNSSSPGVYLLNIKSAKTRKSFKIVLK